MNCNKRAFSFVEIIITLSIIVLLAVIGLNANNNYQDRTSNAKIVSDIETIKNALTEYANESNSLPMPGGNNNFFKLDAGYAHSYDDNETFGVHGFITEDTISKKYLQVAPLDPITNQYYAYGKTKEQNDSIANYSKVANQFELAGVFKQNNVNSAFVRGNYTAEVGPFNLIREYNGPNFVFDEGIYLPYNGDDRLLTARIGDYTGNVTVNGSNESISTKELISGDEIVVPGGETATIYFSDGSKSILGDAGVESTLTLSQLDFMSEDNLATKIKLVLGGGTLWSKASHLGDDSGFEIYTTDSTAAVRGTIFGVNKASTSTNVTIQKGKIEIAKVTSATNTDTLNTQIAEDSVEKTLIPNTNGTDADSIIESDGASKGITIEGGTGNTSNDTKAKDTIEEDVVDEMINEVGTISNTVIPEIESFTSDGENFEVAIALNDTYKNADFLKIEYNTDNKTASLFNIFTQANAGETLVAYLDNTWKESGSLILNQNTAFTHPDGTTIKLGELRQITIFFGTNLGDGSTLETRGKVITLDGSLSYERNEDGVIAGIIDSSAGSNQDDNEVNNGDSLVDQDNNGVIPDLDASDIPGDDVVTSVTCTIDEPGYSNLGDIIGSGEDITITKLWTIDGGTQLYTKIVTCDSEGNTSVESLPIQVTCETPDYEKDGDSCKKKETITNYRPITAGTPITDLGLDGKFIINLKVSLPPTGQTKYLLFKQDKIRLYFDNEGKVCFKHPDYSASCTNRTTDIHFERDNNNQIILNRSRTGKYVYGNIDDLLIGSIGIPSLDFPSSLTLTITK